MTQQPLGPHSQKLRDQSAEALEQMDPEPAAQEFEHIAAAFTAAAAAARNRDHEGVATAIHEVWPELEAIVLSRYLALGYVASARVKDLEEN